MWTTSEWKSASSAWFTMRSTLLQDIDTAMTAYDEILMSHRYDITLQISALELIVAAIDKWYEEEGRNSNRRFASIKLYDAAKLQKNLLKTKQLGDQKAMEEQKQLFASIQSSLGNVLKAPPLPPRTPVNPTVPLTREQQQEIADTLTQARKQLLATKLGRRLWHDFSGRSTSAGLALRGAQAAA